MTYKFLNKIKSPSDMKRYSVTQLEQLCAEIRHFLIESVSKSGGHLSSNLGVIELTVALHRCLNSPQDQIVFDVGHQCYTHKLLTGRQDGFANLRTKGGLSGFPSPSESPHDIFNAGHGSTSISAAIGLARAKKLQGQKGIVVAVIGDGAFTGGMVYEAINNISGLDNLVVILNDNTMSISKNTGALAQYLTKLRTSQRYSQVKNDVKFMLDKTPIVGNSIKHGIQNIKTDIRQRLYHTTFFEEMGMRHVGPIDGHDITSLCSLLSSLNRLPKPLFIHVSTKKGKGFEPAEQNPGAFHGISAVSSAKISDPDMAHDNSFSTTFGKKLAELADKDSHICAITAAMKYGTGLQYMKKEHQNRFFDVGMAEEHAVTFAAGLAANGMRPVVAIYSTFLQRAYDQFIHDVMLCEQDVLFAIDRAGLVPGDGETHQGIYDAAFLSQQPNLPIISPSNYNELNGWLEKLMQKDYKGPRAIRYPRGGQPQQLAEKPFSGELFDKVAHHPKAKAAIISYGSEICEAMAAAQLATKQKLPTNVYQMLMINPIPPALIEQLMQYSHILFAEDGIAKGGIAEHMAMQLLEHGYKGTYTQKAITNIQLDHADVATLRKDNGLDADSLCATLLNMAGHKK